MDIKCVDKRGKCGGVDDDYDVDVYVLFALHVLARGEGRGATFEDLGEPGEEPGD